MKLGTVLLLSLQKCLRTINIGDNELLEDEDEVDVTGREDIAE